MRVGPQRREPAPAVLLAAAPRAAAARPQVLQDQLHLRLRRRLREDRRVAQHAVVQGHLGLHTEPNVNILHAYSLNICIPHESSLDTDLSGLLARRVAGEGEALVQVQVEVLERAMLNAERLQSGPIDLINETCYCNFINQ